jgi:predicted DCC family thiol-disulfide oxidoreductase YuxK
MSMTEDAAPRFMMFYDGECPLCRHEVQVLRWLDRGRGRLGLVDIADPEFDAQAYGRSQDEMMASIHGMYPDGRLTSGVEVFRQSYAAVGLGWLWAVTKLPLIRPLVDRAYAWFAKRRLKLTGRGDAASCETGRCHVVR